MSKNEVAKVKNTEVGANVSYDYGNMAHEGFEDTKITDLSIPFINVLQSNSPEVENQTIEGAKAGDLLNSVTKEIIKQPFVVIPVLKEESWVEWVPRTKGGGLVNRHEPDSEVVKAAIAKNGGSRIPPKDGDGKRIPFKTPAGNDLIETFYVYCLIANEDGTEIEGYCVLSFSSTKIKVHKDWMTSILTLKGRPPIFANRAVVSTQKQQANNKTFFNYCIRPLKSTWRDSLIPPNEEGMALLNEAKEFRSMIMDGLARADVESISGQGADDDVGGSVRTATPDGEIPF